MQVIEHIEKATEPFFSFEIIPPLRGKNIQDIIEIVEFLLPYNPPFIDVTSHSAEAYYSEDKNGKVERTIIKKRPGTISICGIIQNRFNIDTVPHLLCRGFTKEETEDALIELNYLGIHNVLAIRGDETNYVKQKKHRTLNIFASDLVSQISDIKSGKYLNSISNAHSIDFCIGVAGYPEKHFESPNLKTDIEYLQQKIKLGAQYVVTQMFFDNNQYYNFVDSCREEGITVPIIPGIKILKNFKQLSSIPKSFYVNFPNEFVDELSENPENAGEIGIEWTIKQCRDLLENNVNSLHFYIMNDIKSITTVLEQIK